MFTEYNPNPAGRRVGDCADRYEAAQNTRDIIDSQTRGTQAILDKLCSLELDAKNDKISDLERQLKWLANCAR